MEITAACGLLDGRIVERFDCFQDTSAIAKVSKDLKVQGVNFFARRGVDEDLIGVSSSPSWQG